LFSKRLAGPRRILRDLSDSFSSGPEGAPRQKGTFSPCLNIIFFGLAPSGFSDIRGPFSFWSPRQQPNFLRKILVPAPPLNKGSIFPYDPFFFSETFPCGLFQIFPPLAVRCPCFPPIVPPEETPQFRLGSVEIGNFRGSSRKGPPPPLHFHWASAVSLIFQSKWGVPTVLRYVTQLPGNFLSKGTCLLFVGFFFFFFPTPPTQTFFFPSKSQYPGNRPEDSFFF